MTFLYKNNATSRLFQDTAAGSGTIRVQSGDGVKFPTPGGGDYFIVTVEDRRTGQIEIMHCTANAADILTVTRAQEGTAAQDFLAGATVSNRFTAGTIDAILAGAGYSKPEADAKFVDVAGDTMTGPLVLPGDPALATQAARKAYVDAQVATKIGDAPLNANSYGRSNGAWVTVVNSATYTASDVLAKLITVDGAGSLLDADFLDGHDSAYFATQADMTAAQANISSNTAAIATKLDASAYTAADVLAKLITVDGTGSGLDADLLDGQDSAFYRNAGNLNAGILPGARFDDTSHGNRGGGTLHAQATAATAGFMLDAPSNGSTYGRKDGAWAVTAAGLPEAPNDGALYGRQSLGWAKGVKLAGDTMTGLLVLSADPAAALGAASKQYVDGRASPFKRTVLVSSTSAFQYDATTLFADIEVVGGGGGGGGTSGSASVGTSRAGGGGGGGGYAKKLIQVTSAIQAATKTISVAAGGGSGVNGGSSQYTDGTNTVTGAGGTAGFSGGVGSGVNFCSGGGGGAGSGGDFGVGGGSGTNGISAGSTANGASNASGSGGNGAAGPWGGSGLGAQVSQTTSGGANNGGGGAGLGAGGGGGVMYNSSGGNAAGGAGYQGVVIITEYR